MNKLSFLAMVLGLLGVFSGSAAAQIPLTVNSGNVTTAAPGGEILLDLHTRVNKEKGKSIYSLYMKLSSNGKYATALMEIPAELEAFAVAQFKEKDIVNTVRKITKVENPIAVQGRDTLITSLSPTLIQIEVIRNKEPLGVMKIYTEIRSLESARAGARESSDEPRGRPMEGEDGDATVKSGSCGLEPSDTQVFLYEHIDFGGKCVAIPRAGFNFSDMNNPILSKAGVGNDQISSIKVGKRVRAMVCQDNNYQNCESFLVNVKDLGASAVGNDTISSLKVLDKREIVEMTFYNRTDQPIVIYELVGGTNSFLGRLEPNAGGKIYSDLRTTIVAGINNNEIQGSRYQLMDASAKVFNFSYNGNRVIQMTSNK